jgi:hypothetical protein
MRNATPLASARMRAIVKSTMWVAAAGLSAFVAYPAPAQADEPVGAQEPKMMSETAEVTSVVDAFDKDDPFDLNLTLGFEQSWKHANIRRESTLNQLGLTQGGYTATTENVASYSQSISTLNVGADIGLWRDLAIIARLPIILADQQSLSDLNGSSANPQRLQDSNGQQMFKVPFTSPTRSGVDWFSVGLDWAIFNQQRDLTKPTWLVGLEGRFGVGTPLHACNATAGGTPVCPPNGNAGSPNRDPGISRAMDGIAARTVFSRRFGYVEPYSGINILAEFPNGGDFGANSGLAGNLENHPPLVGTFSLGMEVIPYERREQFQRFIMDFRASGTYHSEGREYTELFDALGSTQSQILQNPNPGGFCTKGAAGCSATAGTKGQSVADPSAQQVFFNGITDQLQYVSFGGHFSATWQAGEYIKFVAGVGLTYNQNHVITADQACNPNITNNPGAAGPCTRATGFNSFQQTGVPNPNYRPNIDVPGNRFLSDDGTIVNLWINGVVMF